MAENEKGAPNPADTDTSLPRESWEKKLLEKEHTALFSDTQEQPAGPETVFAEKDDSNAKKPPFGRRLWSLLLLLTMKAELMQQLKILFHRITAQLQSFLQAKVY